ncbi:MAG: toll/interleukin-1 receptor domain-containing protein [Clostridiales bacterium]|nr:toll/interleukin-1 receptor domain-containing protein [Clostridiales bacterium]
MEKKEPKVFISYAWSEDDKEATFVINLGQRLMADGIEVVLDKWDLKEGQDKYEFMERCVNDPEITRVLIICDKNYMNKANARKGGVGDETAIISSEVYGKTRQEKFIPIIKERDSEGNTCIPTYISARLYIDLSNEDKYESEYEKLIRNIYEKPLYKKPTLGKRPEWLDDEDTNTFPVKALISQIKGAENIKRQESCKNRFINEYVETLKTYYSEGAKNGKEIYDQFVKMKDIRDIYLDFIQVVSETELPIADTVIMSFEKMYNELLCIKSYKPDAISVYRNSFEGFRIFLWELFVACIAFLRYIEDYESIHAIVTNTYFLVNSELDNGIHSTNYCAFYNASQEVDYEYKNTTEYKNKLTLLGYTVVKKREKLPIFTGKSLAEADLFLYQIKKALKVPEASDMRTFGYWFPAMYVYVESELREWKKMKSFRYCENKMFDLFGVESLSELKRVISKCEYDPQMGYTEIINAAPTILNSIKLEDIGSEN